MPYVYALPSTPAEARVLLDVVPKERHRKEVTTLLGTMTSRWASVNLSASGALRRTGGREV